MRNDKKENGWGGAAIPPSHDVHRATPARSQRIRRRGLLLLPLMLGACGMFSNGSGTPAPKEPAKLDIAITADADLNTDIKGRGAPLLLRVFELKSEVAFQEAEFFALQASPKAVLGADLLAVDQFILRPGEKREIKRKSNPETAAIGIFAGYRDLPNAVWRVVHKMPPAPDAGWYRAVMPSHKAALQIDLQSNAIVMVDRDAGTRPVRFANESLKGLEQNPPEAGPALPAGPSLQGSAKVPETASSEILDGVKNLFSPPRK